MYTIEELQKTFHLHHERSELLNKKLIAEYKDNNPGEPIPDPYNDDFSLPLALEAICREIVHIKDMQGIMDIKSSSKRIPNSLKGKVEIMEFEE